MNIDDIHDEIDSFAVNKMIIINQLSNHFYYCHYWSYEIINVMGMIVTIIITAGVR